MHLSHTPQCIISNKNEHISVLNSALWDMGQVHCGIWDIGLIVLIALRWLYQQKQGNQVHHMYP